MVEGVVSRNIVSYLLWQSFARTLLKRGLKRAPETGLIYFPKGLLAKNKILYRNRNGRMVPLQVLGERKFRGKPYPRTGLPACHERQAKFGVLGRPKDMSERDWVDWSIEVTYWVPEGGEDPDIPWPSVWECCGYPACDPRHFRNDVPARNGYTYLNMPMYHLADLNQELANICTLIESLPGPERTKWDTLEDRHLRFSAGIPEIHAADLLNTGFALAGPLL